MNDISRDRRSILQGIAGTCISAATGSTWAGTTPPEGPLSQPSAAVKGPNTSVSLLDAESLLDWEPYKLLPVGNILIVGDEIARGDRLNDAGSFAEPLRRLVPKGRDVFNAGIWNATTFHTIGKTEGQLKARSTMSTVIIAAGRGDRVRGLDLFQLSENIRALVDVIHAARCRCLLLALPYSVGGTREDPHAKIAAQSGFVDPSAGQGGKPTKPRELTEEEKARDRLLVDRVFVDMARENKIAVDLYSVSYAVASPETVSPNGLPNAKGNEILARYLWQAIQKYTMSRQEYEDLLRQSAPAS